jgi:hypothetical protein
MAIILKKTDLTKKGWQALRHKDMTKSGMGAALDAWGPYAGMGGKFIIIEDKKNPALAAFALMVKALSAAKAKADKIKDKGEKATALELVGAYKLKAAAWMKDLSLGEKESKKDSGRAEFNSLASVLKDKALRMEFHAHCKKEYSEEGFLFLTQATTPSQAAYDKFIPTSAPLQVNLPNRSRLALEAVAASGELTGDAGKAAWAVAVKEIYNLMLNDTFKRWSLARN